MTTLRCRLGRGFSILGLTSLCLAGAIVVLPSLGPVYTEHAQAQSIDPDPQAPASSTTQKWTAGWDSFGEPLNYAKSKVIWSVAPSTRKLTATFTLVGATPSKLYQVSITAFCSTFPATFGQFPVDGGGGTCGSITRQNVTKTIATVELGVVTTDIHGNGSFKVVIGPVASGTYNVEFMARNGAGCNLIGGGGNDADHCDADFQSPGPTFGDSTAINVP